MIAPGGRRCGRRVLSRLLAVVLLAVVGFVVFRDVGGGRAPTAPSTVVTGVIGSEKKSFFDAVTGGRTFDARTASLAEVFQGIRGYV
jgi:hypothetical protein